jgi:hypothetical protein
MEKAGFWWSKATNLEGCFLWAKFRQKGKKKLEICRRSDFGLFQGFHRQNSGK